MEHTSVNSRRFVAVLAALVGGAAHSFTPKNQRYPSEPRGSGPPRHSKGKRSRKQNGKGPTGYGHPTGLGYATVRRLPQYPTYRVPDPGPQPAKGSARQDRISHRKAVLSLMTPTRKWQATSKQRARKAAAVAK